jgi:transposase InsO family protein
VTIQNILNKRGLGNRYERLLELEKEALSHEIELTPEQVQQIEQANPCFRERHVESSRPGELLCQDTFFVGQFNGAGKVYLHAVVDTFGSYAFGVLGTSKQPEWAVSVLSNDALPFYQDRGITVSAVLTDTGGEFCSEVTGGDRGKEAQHPYESRLALSRIEHRRTKIRSPKMNGFVERFYQTVSDEFFRVRLRGTFYESVAALQTDLDEWLRFYNEERPHLGYRNLGRRPLETVCLFLQGKGDQALASFTDSNAKQEG